MPVARLENLPAGVGDATSVKFVENCEYRLFQRPDDAIHRGLDKQTEADLSQRDNFISNFQPLDTNQVRAMVDDVVGFDQFTQPMKDLLSGAAQRGDSYVVCSSQPRLIDGKPSKNPRYLQVRPDLADPFSRYVADRGVRLFRAIPLDQPIHQPVNAVLLGRRNNPGDPEQGIRPLSVYNPVHYQELPELFMDFISSLTGKSPSTTGAGSEGALTKGPFNALRPAADLNNALVAFILTGLAGYSTPAGHIGQTMAFGHDLSFLIPEVWCRLEPHERDPKFLIGEGYLEPLKDFDHNGERIPASRLGYRMTHQFVRALFGRIFDNPGKVFDDAILKPETQDLAMFVDGVKNIAETQERIARSYLEDGSADQACPPLKALLTIMATGSFEGKDVHHPDIRRMFTREDMLASDWYRQRLATRQQREIALWERHEAYLKEFLSRATHGDLVTRLDIPARLRHVQAQRQRVAAPDYAQSLVGFLGAHPFD